MIIAVASGKGGTGKTTVAASLSLIWDQPLQTVDLDVEEPNLHLFLQPNMIDHRVASLPVPVADQDACTACRACAEICQFKAISVLGEYVLTFPEMCHGCGGCMAVCPVGAITEGTRALGEVLHGRKNEIDFLMGRLRVGEAMSPPLMKEVMKNLDPSRDVVIDAPPGTSCPAMTAVSRADVIVLVSEPTPFGFHDLKLARQAFASMGRPMGVVVNRAGLGDESLYTYCQATGLPILLEIPFDRRVAEAYSNGLIVSEAVPDLRPAFVQLMESIRTMAAGTDQEACHA